MSSNKEESRVKRHGRIRKKSLGSTERPRLNVFKSIKHIYAQIIDDSSHRTIVSAASSEKELKGKLNTGGNIKAAKEVGALVAMRAVEKGIKKVCFDRGGYPYQGRVKSLADAARKAGLEF